MARFRTKPVEFEAEQFTGKMPLPFRDKNACHLGPKGWYVITAHGHETPIAEGDWIREEPDGRGFYPIKPDIAAERFERIG